MTDDHYKIITTRDGSKTLYLPAYDEHMHSLSGAYEEALLKHVYPSGLLGIEKDGAAVLDVGFGLGYNILALIAELKDRSTGRRVSITSLEIDRSLLPALESISFDGIKGELYEGIKTAYKTGAATIGSITITVLFGDARHSVVSLRNRLFDAVFFDPFSPARNPELWTVDYFKVLFRLMTDTAVLTTYSSAPQIRAALLDAGFIIGKGPSVGGKREGTLAAKTRVIEPLSEEELSAIRNDPRAAPYRDETLSGEQDVIRERRKKEISERRVEQKKHNSGER